MISDTNIGIRLKTGELIEVVYPLRVGIEQETPWLDRKGWRQWNTDPAETLVEERDSKYSPRFIVGKWGTGYLSSEGVHDTIPLTLVSSIESLPEDLVKKGELFKQQEYEAERAARRADPERWVKLKELQALESRISELERYIELEKYVKNQSPTGMSVIFNKT
jgi:hypothetical protein